jgi:hypothetical protein
VQPIPVTTFMGRPRSGIKGSNPDLNSDICLPFFVLLDINSLRPNGKYEPFDLTVSNAAFCIYWFCMVLTVNSDHFLKQR